MLISREQALEIADEKTRLKIEKSNDKFFHFELKTESEYKTDSQNRLFHGLLTCFWLSGCSSFTSYNLMRKHYKQIAGLIEYEKRFDFSLEFRKMLFNSFKNFGDETQKNQFILLMNNQVEVELSWSNVTKKGAKNAIDALLKDMDVSGVIGSGQGKKYELILITLGELV